VEVGAPVADVGSEREGDPVDLIREPERHRQIELTAFHRMEVDLVDGVDAAREMRGVAEREPPGRIVDRRRQVPQQAGLARRDLEPAHQGLEILRERAHVDVA
jgi:hypothetical protein